MIAFVEGIVRIVRPASVVLDVNGVGYEVFVCDPYKYRIGKVTFLDTDHQLREDAHTLFGFDTEMDYEIFTRLLNVKGIGAKTALAMLTKCPGADMARAIEEGDVKLLKSLPGIGVKSASQIVLDLQGKLVSIQREEIEIGDPVWMQTQEALEALGYKANTLQSIKKELQDAGYESVDEMLRHALMLLAKRNGV